jgi:hypothetical protein
VTVPTRTHLELALTVLNGREYVPAGLRCQAAAYLARQALETLVLQRCEELGASMPGATMRSRLVVLRVLDRPECSGPAQAAWTGLSRACHRHAYELAPGEGEIRALIALVDEAGRAVRTT